MVGRALVVVALALSLVLPVTAAADVRGTGTACPKRDVPPTEFDDIAGSVHRHAIACAVWYEVVDGRSDERFAPRLAVSRGQIASLLGDLIETAGGQLSDGNSQTFTDTADSVHRRRIEQLAEAEVVSGYDDQTYRPGEPVARAQAATMVVDALDHVGVQLADGEDAFDDDDGSLHEPAIDTAAEAGLIAGVDERRFDPAGDIARGQAASLLARSLDLLVARDHVERPPAPGFFWEHGKIPPDVRRDMRGSSYRSGCPVGLDDLVLAELYHRGFDGRIHRGELVVARSVAADVRSVFRRAFEADFPLRRVRRVDHYDADDDKSMAANNTSAFNCRRIAGTDRWSEHAYGTAIDLNPVQNPYVSGSTVEPEAGREYTDRDDVRKGMIVTGRVVVDAFDRIGWGWGGRWSKSKDYQHFSETGG